ncbi:MAG: tetratricopeptide repeat protein [Gemmatimonadaceae bacterium]|nr:tetratricopeptide repeat protein [Gemmatimonadaceae bacterium]
MTKTGEAARPRLEDSAESLMEWVQSHGRQLGIGAIVVVALAAGSWVVSRSNDTKAAGASRALSEAQRSMASGNLALAAADLQKVVSRYGSTTAGTQARLLLAQVQFQQGKVADGMKVLDEVGSAGAMQASLHALRGAGLEQSGKPAEAAAEYLKASTASTLPSERESYKADAARAYVTAGKKDEALKIWEAIAADEASPLNGEARLRVGELSATVATR